MIAITADQLRRAAIGVVCVLLSMIGPGLASEFTCSLTYERATAIGHAAARADPTNVFTDYGGAEAARLLAAINAMPPATAYPAERILAIEQPGDDFVMIALVHDGCAGKKLWIISEMWRELRRGAIGDPL